MGFTPHPAGDMSIEEAMNVWGKDIIIWVSFPEAVLFEGIDKARNYTRNLLINSNSKQVSIMFLDFLNRSSTALACVFIMVTAQAKAMLLLTFSQNFKTFFETCLAG